MKYATIIRELSRNKEVFKGLLSGLTEEEYSWRHQPEKWCLLEIVNHLYDEEREDFRTRTRCTLQTPGEQPPPIDPVAWVTEREYMQQDYAESLDKFLEERDRSVEWLQSLRSPNWDNSYQHPKLGTLTAKMFLSNWLAHDYLHIRQIIRLKHAYLKELTQESLTYAGEW